MFHPLNGDIIILKARHSQELVGGFHLYSVYRKSHEIQRLRKSGLLEMFYDISPDGYILADSDPVK
jgi:hypothetical protein